MKQRPGKAHLKKGTGAIKCSIQLKHTRAEIGKSCRSRDVQSEIFWQLLKSFPFRNPKLQIKKTWKSFWNKNLNRLKAVGFHLDMF